MGLLGLPMLGAPSAYAEAGAPKPTVVLVHGAFAGPSSWNEVAAGLAKDGYTTVAPALGLSSVADDAAIVSSALDAVPGPKILVAHSYGGVVVSNAATGRGGCHGAGPDCGVPACGGGVDQ